MTKMKVPALWGLDHLVLILCFSALSVLAFPAQGFPWAGGQTLWENAEIHGFIETRAGWRTRSDPHERAMSVADTLIQAEAFTYTDAMDFKFKGDLRADGIRDTVGLDTREAWTFFRLLDRMDVTIGRQVLTWGTGELVFVNDLFPKDWQSFFLGRDDAYLKAPSDAVKLSFFTGGVGIDLVYTPKFDPDLIVTGETLSHWNGPAGRLSGRDDILEADRPGSWFRDHELALRVFGNLNNWELALYGYQGFWKTPSETDDQGRKRLYSDLGVYGASVRGQALGGIVNLEFAFYDSQEDRDGDLGGVENSQMRYLAGYTRDLARDFNASLQYYVEQILDHEAYEAGIFNGRAKDRFRQVITLQLTQLLMNQTLTLGLSAFICPGDRDGYLRPKLSWQYTDELVFQAGANIFFGRDSHTMFGQLEKNTNVYAAVRYHF